MDVSAVLIISINHFKRFYSFRFERLCQIMMNIKRPKTPKGFSSIPLDVSPSKLLSPTEQFEEGTHDIITLAPELDAKIAKVLGEGENRSIFNTIQSVNEIFPTEDSINGADEVLARVKGQIDAFDAELRQLVQVKSTEKQTIELINQIKAEIKVKTRIRFANLSTA